MHNMKPWKEKNPRDIPSLNPASSTIFPLKGLSDPLSPFNGTYRKA